MAYLVPEYLTIFHMLYVTTHKLGVRGKSPLPRKHHHYPTKQINRSQTTSPLPQQTNQKITDTLIYKRSGNTKVQQEHYLFNMLSISKHAHFHFWTWDVWQLNRTTESLILLRIIIFQPNLEFNGLSEIPLLVLGSRKES